MENDDVTVVSLSSFSFLKSLLLCFVVIVVMILFFFYLQNLKESVFGEVIFLSYVLAKGVCLHNIHHRTVTSIM